MRSLVLVAILALAACGGGGSGEKPKGAAPAPRPPAVSVITIQQTGPAGAIRATGTLAFQQESILSFKVGGVIASISVDEGDTVRAGQTLASLNLTELSASLSESDSQLRTAEAQLTRTKTLFEKGFVAQARLDDAQLALDRARAARQSVGFNRSQGVIVAPAIRSNPKFPT
jgi:multidrug efflux pump subunit AcrA (membrane-fusion protein)